MRETHSRIAFVISLLTGLMVLSACAISKSAVPFDPTPPTTTETSNPKPRVNTPTQIRNTSTPDPSPTPRPTRTVTPTPSPTPTVTPTPTALPSSAYLEPLNHQWQTLNNCHRASIAILMAFYDVWFTQDDYDLGMDSLDEFVAPYGLTARIFAVRYSPELTSDIVRWLLAEDIPVIIGQDLSRGDNTWHYRVAYGYNDATQEIYLDDPLLGPNLRLSYETFNSLSRGIGQIIPVYPTEMDEKIQAQMKAWQMKVVEYPR